MKWGGCCREYHESKRRARTGSSAFGHQRHFANTVYTLFSPRLFPLLLLPAAGAYSARALCAAPAINEYPPASVVCTGGLNRCFTAHVEDRHLMCLESAFLSRRIGSGLRRLTRGQHRASASPSSSHNVYALWLMSSVAWLPRCGNSSSPDVLLAGSNGVGSSVVPQVAKPRRFSQGNEGNSRQ
jgi:hypothetical protein